MTGDQLKLVSAFEDSLKVGDPVKVCWTNSGYKFSGTGVMAKINTKSFVVTLSTDVSISWNEKYSQGQRITVPRIDNIRLWSGNNRVEPVGGDKE